ncbi:hypothetical protein NC651_010757 [Populus alba x Populus x berolinensis]|nr:hypothetical protein NC651_010757 [Populus alba x Populus x berolinensis]
MPSLLLCFVLFFLDEESKWRLRSCPWLALPSDTGRVLSIQSLTVQSSGERRANEVTGKQFRRSLYLCNMWNGNFDITIWICVSDDSSVEKLTRAMKESIQNSPCDIEGLDN